MRRRPVAHGLGIACLIAGLISGTAVRAPAAPTTDALALHVANSSAALQRYRTTHALNDLRAATLEMESAVNLDAITPQTLVDQRRALVRGWALLLEAIDSSYDPTYDANDPKNRIK